MLPKLDIATKERSQSQSETKSDENRMLPDHDIDSQEMGQSGGVSGAENDEDEKMI